MKIIQEATEKLRRVWPAGNVIPGSYRLFTYIISETVDDATLLCNVASGEMVMLTAEETLLLSKLPCEYESWMDELIRGHYLVRAELDDVKTVETLRTALRTIGVTKEIKSYVIAPTTHCNARCFYCYEYGIEHKSMTDETADKLVEFMDSHRGGKEVSISWFGGEPLVGIRQIDRICAALKQREIPFHSSMVSNGYLITEEIAGRVKQDWHLRHIQITLDGTEKVYNEIKAYVNPCGSPYERVIHNIECLSDNGVKVNIRLNLGFHNADDLDVLSKQLVERFSGRDNVYAYPAMLYDDCGSKPQCLTEEDTRRLYERWTPIAKTLSALGAKGEGKPGLPHLGVVNCMADGNDCVFVTPDGNLSKCEHYVDSHFVGNLDTGVTNKEELKLFARRRIFPQCPKCPMFPKCTKLEMCTNRRQCAPAHIEAMINGVKKNMKELYEDYLRNE